MVKGNKETFSIVLCLLNNILYYNLKNEPQQKYFLYLCIPKENP